LTSLQFTVLDARAEAHAAVPTLTFRIRAVAAAPVHAILLHARLRIEPIRRLHNPSEQERMLDLFGEPPRWKNTLRPLIWSRSSVTVPAFESSVEIEVPVVCTYDFEVAAAKYLDALEGGDIPLLFLFSGTVFAKTESGFQVEQIAWDNEASFCMPVRVWRDLMDAHFPGCAWLRIGRPSLDALQRFRARHGLLSWDEVIDALLDRREAAAR
jgi:Family of unknown function (DUF6084)